MGPGASRGDAVSSAIPGACSRLAVAAVTHCLPLRVGFWCRVPQRRASHPRSVSLCRESTAEAPRARGMERCCVRRMLVLEKAARACGRAAVAPSGALPCARWGAAAARLVCPALPVRTHAVRAALRGWLSRRALPRGVLRRKRCVLLRGSLEHPLARGAYCCAAARPGAVSHML